MTYDGTTARLYGDGVQVASQAKSWNTTLGRAHIGQQVNDASEFWNGLIDDVRLYNHALSIGELQRVIDGLIVEQAHSPSPSNGTSDASPDGGLGWGAGEGATAHDVYFGTASDDIADASRTDPRGVLVSQGQSAPAYDPGPLELEQTYYWRIDEVADSTIVKGQVWSFTTEPVVYTMENIVVTTNTTSESGVTPENIVNGSGLNEDDQHSTSTADMWAGALPADGPLYIQFEFDGLYKLKEMLIWNYNDQYETFLGFGLQNVTVQYSENGLDWNTWGNLSFAQATCRADYVANTTLDLHGIAARHIRLEVHTVFGTAGKAGLSEVRFLYVPVLARQPQPPDGEVGVNPNSVLQWRAGREADWHEVHFSDDEAALGDGTALIETVADNSYPLSGLDLQYDHAYYWKIVEVNDAEAVNRWESDIWSFTTQAYGLVENFESYDDQENRIYFEWIDGWDNGTGSTVGHWEKSFAETGIVHRGSQSMPLYYDNVGGATTSEADRIFDIPRNWTTNGVQSLSLYFCGDTSNTGGQLYLKINDTKVVFDGDIADLSTSVWMAWNIDLSAVGADLTNVTTLTIGIEGAGAQGILYVDDIRLYPTPVAYITPAEPDSANLVGHYALDGNANDSSGHGYDGTEMNGSTYVDGWDGQAARFSGAEQYIDLGNPADWASGTAPRSMAAWALTNSVDAGYRWIAAYGSAGTGQAMFIGINGTTLYGGGYADDVILYNFWEEGEWYHIGLTYDGTTARLYADGIEVASGPKNWNLVSGRAHLGRQVNDQFEYWAGLVDEVRIYDEALSAGEMAWLAGRTVPLHQPF